MSNRFRNAALEVRDKIRIIRRRRHRKSTKSSHNSVILGRSLPITDGLADTAHLSILNFPAERDGYIKSISIHLGQKPPGEGNNWGVLVYEMVGSHRFQLVSKRKIKVDPNSRIPQCIAVVPKLSIKKGQYVGLVNKDGKLRLTYTRGWESDITTWDLWYQESKPSGDIGSVTTPLYVFIRNFKKTIS